MLPDHSALLSSFSLNPGRRWSITEIPSFHFYPEASLVSIRKKNVFVFLHLFFHVSLCFLLPVSIFNHTHSYIQENKTRFLRRSIVSSLLKIPNLLVSWKFYLLMLQLLASNIDKIGFVIQELF